MVRPALILTVLAFGCASERVIEPPLVRAPLPVEPVLDAPSTVTEAGRTMTIPEPEAPETGIVERLQAAPGLEVTLYAEGIVDARMMAVDRRTGIVYVTSPKTDSVYLLQAGRQGIVDHSRHAIRGLPRVYGIAIRGDRVWLAGEREIWSSVIKPDGTFGAPKTIVRDLPEGGLHPQRTLGFDPSGRLFVSIGSGCNVCTQDVAEHATMISMKPDGSDRKIYARGLRSTIGFGWHPSTGALWGVDHGADGRDPEAPEELNQIVEGGHYGWPYAYGKQQVDPLFEASGKISKEELAQRSVGAILELPAHSSPSGMIFYRGRSLPSDYQGDALIALRGPRNRVPPVGYKVVRVHFENGLPTGVTDFLTGFSDGEKIYGRLSGLEVSNDGAVLVADQHHGYIYRVAAREIMEARN
jgi:glucose/arabinose dehydrogenase